MSAAARHTGAADGVLRVGIPLELPADLLARPWQCSPPSTPIPGSSPNTCPRAPSSRSWRPVSSTSAWFANIRWAATGMRSGSSVKSSAFSSPPRSVRSWPVPTESAVDAGPRTSDASLLMGDVKLAAVAGGDMFAFAPPNWSQPIPESVCRQPWWVTRSCAPRGQRGRPIRTAAISANFIAALGDTGATTSRRLRTMIARLISGISATDGRRA